MGTWRQANTGIQRFTRTVVEVPVRVSTIDPEIDPVSGRLFFRSAEETTADLSGGGAYIRSLEPLEAGRRVIVDIDLAGPGGGPLQLVARVVWTQRQFRAHSRDGLNGPGFGIHFIRTSSTELARLTRYLDGLSKESRIAPAIKPPPAAPQP